MPEDLDIAVARYVRTAGLATQEQVMAAMQEQARQSAQGTPLSLSDALLKLGFITDAQHSMVVQKAKSKGGVQQFLHYKLLKKLGEGGMGAVYLADDTQQMRKVAVKVLPKKYSDDVELLKRFKREADAAFKLKHPNIVGAYGLGEDLGYHFYVMEYCEGETLDATLKREQRLPLARALEIILQACRGLRYAHEQGFIHRDIKPANIILTKDGAARILDLGLSKNLEDTEGSFKTVSGAVLGTPHYISPEQALGEKNVDGRADIYSLGATLYHLTTGQTPFDGTTILEILSKQVNAQLPNPQDLREEIPDGVVNVLRRMMAKDAVDRYRDCGEVIEDLEHLISGKAPATKVLDPNLSAIALVRKKALPKRPATLRRPAKPRSAAGLWIAVAAAAAVAVVAYLMAGGKDAPPPTAPVARDRKLPPPVVPPKGTIDLLALADPARHAVDGAWKKEAAGLRGDGQYARLDLPFDAPEEYDFRIEFTRHQGTDVAQLLSAAGHRFTWHLGGWGNTIVGFAAFEGKTRQDNPTGVSLFRGLTDGQKYVCLLEIRRDRMTGYLDGEKIVDAKTDYSDAKEMPDWKMPDPKRLGLGVMGSVTFHSATVREVSGKRAVPDDPWKNAVDLMALIDPAKDTVSGRWTLKEGELFCEASRYSKIEIPYRLPEEYDFRIELTRLNGSRGAGQILRKHGQNFVWLLNDHGNELCGFDMISGKGARENATSRKVPDLLKTGRRFTSVVQVRKDGLKAYVDGILVVEWKTNYADLSIYPDWALRDGTLLGLGTIESGFVFHRVQLLDVSGRGSPLREGMTDAVFGATVAGLPPDEQVTQVLARLKDLHPRFKPKEKHRNDQGIVVDLSFSSSGITDISPVAALTGLRKLDCTGTWDEATSAFDRTLADLSPLSKLRLKVLACGGSLVSDLKPLAGMPLEILDIGGTAVADLSPLKKLPLVELTCTGTPVTDLQALLGLRLKMLACEWTKIWDLAPLKGMPLEILHVAHTAVGDLSPLSGMPLRELRIDVVPEKDLPLLKSMKTLVKINDKPASEFWMPATAVTKGLVGHWTFDEGKGVTAADASGNGHTARLNGSPVWAPGKIRGGLKFRGMDDWVELPNSAALDALQEGSHTICAWFKPEGVPVEGDPKDKEFALVVKPGRNDGIKYHTVKGVQGFGMEHWLKGDVFAGAYTEDAAFPPTRFYHVAGVVDKTAGKTHLFVDGVLQKSAAWAPQTPTRDYGKATWRVGIMLPSAPTSRWAAKGVIDEVRLYNRALTAVEIGALHRASEGAPAPETGLDDSGFIRRWLVLAPISLGKDPDAGAELRREQIPNEADLLPRAGGRVKVGNELLTWAAHLCPADFVDFNAFLRKETDLAVAYAATYLVAEKETSGVSLLMGCNDLARVYLNGKEVLRYDIKARPMKRDEDACRDLVLKKGTNVLIFKVANEFNQWQGCIRLTDGSGRPLRGVRAVSDPP